jgi:hypothetical protein
LFELKTNINKISCQKNELAKNVLSDNHLEWLDCLQESMLVGSYGKDSVRKYRLERQILFQFHCDKNAINTYEKSHQPINHKLQSVLKTQKSLDEKPIVRTDKNYRRSISRLAGRYLFHRLVCVYYEILVIDGCL